MIRPLKSLLALVAVAGILSGCLLGPNYQRPEPKAPDRFRFSDQAGHDSVGDLPWWNMFQDPALQSLVLTALTNNQDLAKAAARVEQARFQSVAVAGSFLPQVGYGVDVGHGRNALYNSPAALGGGTASSGLVGVNAFWEIDFWGRIRRSSEAARARYLATEQGRRALGISLMSEVAFHYFHLLQLDAEVAIGRRATNAYAGSYRIFNERLQRGVASRLEVDRAAAALASAASLIPALELEVARTESALSLLLGTSPGPIERGTLASQTLASPQVPVGLPSDLLERRPDVLAAEQSLVAANAGIGVSVANYFPQIGLTALMGRASPELSAFTSGAGNFANLGGTLTGPIFRGGQLRAQREEAKAKFREAEANYQQTVLAAFKDVSDALATRQKLAEQRAFYLTAATHLDSSVSLAQDRYLNGKSSYYEVLQAQQELYPAQRAIAQMQAGELIAVVRLYKALGGGWSQTVTNSVPHKVEPVE